MAPKRLRAFHVHAVKRERGTNGRQPGGRHGQSSGCSLDELLEEVEEVPGEAERRLEEEVVDDDELELEDERERRVLVAEVAVVPRRSGGGLSED